MILDYWVGKLWPVGWLCNYDNWNHNFLMVLVPDEIEVHLMVSASFMKLGDDKSVHFWATAYRESNALFTYYIGRHWTCQLYTYLTGMYFYFNQIYLYKNVIFSLLPAWIHLVQTTWQSTISYIKLIFLEIQEFPKR